METEVTSEPKSNGVANGGARIVVDDDDEVLRYGEMIVFWLWHIVGTILNNS